jgi:hypothetical protein
MDPAVVKVPEATEGISSEFTGRTGKYHVNIIRKPVLGRDSIWVAYRQKKPVRNITTVAKRDTVYWLLNVLRPLRDKCIK